ncbi:transcriptional regulator, TetR family [Beutenbergia cavernae DSM 12333]|uniref:Transcriptional regulator, TetR family n=1 Tax=Beutenbergia cavernae (strain ATCC BAA-8 / DSM 12333 / CCUG 43141 / JCM 11478 / NBRC 16432 / NCIMB 13614 / HKI 0122) TaxID=471853 RepID=C5C4K2_BEUC1|nr:TetR/AcrR family transcriptional regulator C-terminal domain-containing protein [Beutenbergia cavernae]ACQ82126.1 transcriptional regulator, TetR family [Beutenbergia cavernae DSM 12333]
MTKADDEPRDAGATGGGARDDGAPGGRAPGGGDAPAAAGGPPPLTRAQVDEIAKERGLELVRTAEADRRLALLWESPAPRSRGRRPRLSLDEVVEAGIAVAREDGLDALSMRRVAQRLDVGAMSLYTYVPGRTELVDLMIDRAYAGLDLPAAGEPWRTGLQRYARAFWDLFHAHPWLLQANLWRAPLAPHVLDAQEAGLRTIIDTGLPPERVVDLIGMVDNYVRGLARADIAEVLERERTGQDYDTYWASLSSFWEDYFDVERYPTMTRIWAAGGFEHETGGLDDALERLLDAVESAIERATSS